MVFLWVVVFIIGWCKLNSYIFFVGLIIYVFRVVILFIRWWWCVVWWSIMIEVLVRVLVYVCLWFVVWLIVVMRVWGGWVMLYVMRIVYWWLRGCVVCWSRRCCMRDIGIWLGVGWVVVVVVIVVCLVIKDIVGLFCNFLRGLFYCFGCDSWRWYFEFRWRRLVVWWWWFVVVRGWFSLGCWLVCFRSWGSNVMVMICWYVRWRFFV